MKKKKISVYLFIVIATVIGTSDYSRSFLGVGSDKVYLWIVEYLVMLVGCELVHVELHHLLGSGHHRLGLHQRGGGP